MPIPPRPNPSAFTSISSVLEKLHDRRLSAAVSVVSPAPGSTVELCLPSTGIYVHVTWATLLSDGTLKVFFDTTDVTAYLDINHERNEAKGLLPSNQAPFAKIGQHTIKASGEFLSNLLPLRIVRMEAHSTFSTSPG